MRWTQLLGVTRDPTGGISWHDVPGVEGVCMGVHVCERDGLGLSTMEKGRIFCVFIYLFVDCMGLVLQSIQVFF